MLGIITNVSQVCFDSKIDPNCEDGSNHVFDMQAEYELFEGQWILWVGEESVHFVINQVTSVLSRDREECLVSNCELVRKIGLCEELWNENSQD